MTTAPTSEQRESTKKVLLERLKDPSLSESEIERIKKKLEVLQAHE